MKEPTMEEILALVEFQRDNEGRLHLRNVRGDVLGDVVGCVVGSVRGDIGGNVEGTVNGTVTGLVLGKIAGCEWKFYGENDQ